MRYSIILVIFFYSCDLIKNNIYHDLPIEYKTFLSDKDTLVYQSNDKVDTFIVRVINNAEFQEALSGTSCKEPYEFWEFEYIQYNKPDNQSQSYIDYLQENNILEFGECAMGLPDNFNSIQIHYGIRGVYLPIIEYKEIYYQCMDTLDAIIINNLEFENVYQYKPTQFMSEFSEIYFNYQEGILKYIYDTLTYQLKTSSSI